MAVRRRLRVQALFGVLLVALVAIFSAWRYDQWLKERMYWFTSVRGMVNPAARVRGLNPGQIFRDCVDCPEMVLVPPGKFLMGSSRTDNEIPEHDVTIVQPFAVSRFEVTFREWDACAAHGDCDPHVSDGGWGRGPQPIINVSWDDAKRYVTWLSRITGEPYRLMSEAEWEYAARAGTRTAYFWGDEIGENNANCDECGSRWSRQPAPVGQFAANAFGLHDMHGNVWEWVEDCYHSNYTGAPTDGSVWSSRSCNNHMLRGGSYGTGILYLRSAAREYNPTISRGVAVGFRVARTLDR